MSNKDNITDIDTDNDFGFTFTNESELSNDVEISNLQDRLKQLRDMFLPLLENLNKNPDKDMIKWPNRKAVLDKQIKKLKELTNI
jgi:hypothetical protein